jgi:hypothetical protein
VEIEAIDPAFNGGSSVGPLDPPAILPGPAEFWSGAAEAGADPPDDPTLAAPVSVTAGATQSGIDVILNAIPPAANDACAAATVVAAAPFLDVVNTTAATTAASDPLQSCTFGGPSRNEASVWYRFTPASTATVVVDTLASDYDTVLTVHSGGCGVLTPVACNDDAGSGLQSALTFVAAAGTSYLIEATAYEGTPGGKLELALDALPGCGDGVVGAGEACDAGPANGSDGCCAVTCTLVDTDGDGRCDRDDVCPAVADPAQADADGDGLGDACDICRTTVQGQTAWVRPRLVASGVDDGLAGNDRLRLVGQFRLATGAFTVDPLANGASVELRAGSGLPRLSAVLPPGAFTPSGPGWTRSASGNRYTFRDPTGQSALGGSSRMLVKDRGNGLVQVVLSASRTSLGLAAEDAPLAATVVLGGALAGTNGECGEVSFPGPPSVLACRVSATGTRIVCD